MITEIMVLACAMAFVWGVCWAFFLEYIPLGRYLAVHRTWITVVIGVGVDLLILLAVIPWSTWLPVTLIIATSSLGVILRGLKHEYDELREVLGNGNTYSPGQ